MRVCVISPFVSGKKPHLTPSPASKYDILNFIDSICCFYDFIVLAGYEPACYPTEIDVQNTLRRKQSFANVFIETGGRNQNSQLPAPLNNPNDYKAFFVSAAKRFPMPKQIFSENPTVAHINLLQKHIQERFYDVRDKKILLLICGEIDVFTYDTVNEKNIVEVDFGNGKEKIDLDWEVHQKKEVDIIINPTYTPRGLALLTGTLRNLSMNQKIVIHIANNNQNHTNKKLRNTIKIFFNKKNPSIVPKADFHLEKKYKLTWFSFEIKTDNLNNKQLYYIDGNHNSTEKGIYFY
jgi:uncharacterized Fe-S cluster protein YjdI